MGLSLVRIVVRSLLSGIRRSGRHVRSLEATATAPKRARASIRTFDGTYRGKYLDWVSKVFRIVPNISRFR